MRRAGGYAKDETLFSEFAWADFLRDCMRAEDLNDNFATALQNALNLSRGIAAFHLRTGGAAPIESEVRGRSPRLIFPARSVGPMSNQADFWNHES